MVTSRLDFHHQQFWRRAVFITCCFEIGAFARSRIPTLVDSLPPSEPRGCLCDINIGVDGKWVKFKLSIQLYKPLTGCRRTRDAFRIEIFHIFTLTACYCGTCFYHVSRQPFISNHLLHVSRLPVHHVSIFPQRAHRRMSSLPPAKGFLRNPR